MFTAPLIGFDARLRDQVIGWLLAHGHLLGARQVLSVANRLPAVPDVMADFSATLYRAGGPAWVGHEVGTVIDGEGRPLQRRLDMVSASMALLRLRAALGIHARSEVLAVLADDRERALTHADLALYIASTPRNVRLALDDLVLAGVVTTAGRRYRCVDAAALRAWIGPIPAAPAWPTVVPVVTALRQALLSADEGIERAVRVRRVLDHHAGVLGRLDLPAPPAAAGRELVPAVRAWLLDLTDAIRVGVEVVAQ